MTVTIYHNRDCGTSRNTLAMIRQSGEEPTIVEYLKTPPSRARLQELIAARGIPVRSLLREKGTPYAELGLADPKWTDVDLLDFMMAHPILINRPIVGAIRRLGEPGSGGLREGLSALQWFVRFPEDLCRSAMSVPTRTKPSIPARKHLTISCRGSR